MTANRRIEAGPLLALLGGALLLVSLFLDWYEPGLTAWDVFEIVDLLLVALAVAAILASFGRLRGAAAGVDPSVLPWIAGAAFVLVVSTLLDRPPVVGDGDPEVGLWLALAGSACLAAGALLSIARISMSFDLQPRERTRTTAVVAGDEPVAAVPPTEETVALPEDRKP